MSTPSSNARQKAFRVRTAFAVGLIALPVALFLIATVVAQQASRSMASSASFQRLTAADTQPQYLLSLLLDSETSLRGYLLTGNRQHLVALDRAVPKIEPALKGLDQVTAVIPDRAREVEALRFAARHKISAIENILRLAQAGRTDAAMHMVRSGAGLKNMTEIRRIVADLTVPLGQLRVAQQQKQRRSLHMTNMLVIALLAVITVFVLLSAAMIFAYLRENERILRARDDSEEALLSLTEQLNLEKERLLITVKDLAAAKRMAENANRAKSDFLATMSHELRTPLNAILGFSEMIESEMFGPIGVPQYVGYAGDVHKSGQHLLKLIDDILDLSKIDAGKVEIHEEAMDISDLVRESISLVHKNASRSRVALRQDTGNAPGIIGDRRLLKQILLNLLSNAIKFTPAGGTVTVYVFTGEAGTGERVSEQGMTITVADTGIGMSEDDITKAMQPYGQVDSRVARKHQGTGLGLPISRALAKLHGGDLVICSTPGKGSAISLLLPAHRLQTAAPVVSIARAVG